MRDIIVLAIVAACSLIAIFRPIVGMYCAVWLSFLSPHGMTWGIARTLPLSKFVVIGTLTGFIISKGRKRIPLTRESILLLALGGIFCVTTYFAIYYYAARDQLNYVFKIYAMIFLCTALINDESRLLFLIRIISLSLGFFAIKGGIHALWTGGQYNIFGPDLSWLSANNSIGLALSMNIPILYYLIKIDTNKWCRRIYRIALVLSYPAVVCTFSRGAWLGMGVATGLILLRHRRKELLIPAAIMFFITIGVLLTESLPEKVLGRYDQLVNYKSENSAESRFWNWELCKRVGNANPIFGAGFAWDRREVIAKYYPEFLKRWPGKVWNCHSIWYSIFSEHGYLGLILWISLLVSCLVSIKRMRSYGKSHPEKSIHIYYANMLEGGLISYMIVGTFINAAYFEILYYLIAIVIIIKFRIRQSLKSEGPTAEALA